MALSPAKHLSVSYAEEFVFQIERSILQSRNLIILEWMERIEDETSGWSSAFETEFRERETERETERQREVFIDLPLTMTPEHDLSTLNSRLTHVRAVLPFLKLLLLKFGL